MNLTIQEASHLLGISPASLKNWVKRGLIKDSQGFFLDNDIRDLKDKVSSGLVDRLNTRANKTSSKTRFIPTEYINLSEIEDFKLIIDYIIKFNIKPSQALFLLAINLLVQKDEISRDFTQTNINFNSIKHFRRENVYLSLKNWYQGVGNREIQIDNEHCSFLLNAKIPSQVDVLGLIYQSIQLEGDKSALGSYYTPKEVVLDIITDTDFNYKKVLDPCCGTGQFLLILGNKVDNPESIWGCDIDNIAVEIARINILLLFSDIDFKPNIFAMNSLLDLKEKDFTLIATNPPWGSKNLKDYKNDLVELYPEITSNESFSYFLISSIKKLAMGGHFSIIFPESILYVKNHMDIRDYVLNNSTIIRLKDYGRIFKNVFTAVVLITGRKNVNNEKENNYSRFKKNPYKIFNIKAGELDNQIIEKIYSKEHTTLLDKSKWALGIVTGDNNHYLSKNKIEGYEPIYRGKDIVPMGLKQPELYIDSSLRNLQQIAPREFYRADEKLIYKFISNKLVFAYDDTGALTLNSANILIPEVPGFKVKDIGLLLNTNTINFVFKKIFNPLKILKGDLEYLPIPIVPGLNDNFPCTITDLDNALFEFYGFDTAEIATISNL